MDGVDGTLRWRVPMKVPIAKLIVGGILATLGVLYAAEPWQIAVAGAAAAGLVIWAARDLVAPVRLAADGAGVTLVSGFARQHRLGWRSVERVRVDVRRRSRMLEVDTGEALYLFSRYDLNADLDDVAARLETMRAQSH